MENASLNVLNTNLVVSIDNVNQLVLHNDSSVLQIVKSNAVLEVPINIVRILAVTKQGPPGAGLMALQNDPNPTLGGNLILGPYNIIGQLENNDFVIDGGLL